MDKTWWSCTHWILPSWCRLLVHKSGKNQSVFSNGETWPAWPKPFSTPLSSSAGYLWFFTRACCNMSSPWALLTAHKSGSLSICLLSDEWIWIWVALWEPQYLWTFFTWACHICSLLWVNMNMSGSLRTSVQCSQIEKRDQPEPNLPQFFNASFFFNVFTNKLPKGCHCHVGQFAKLQEAWWAPRPQK